MGEVNMSDLNTKNGKTFEAETEYLYQKKLEELITQRDKLAEALKTIRDFKTDAETEQYSGEIARMALKDAGLE